MSDKGSIDSSKRVKLPRTPDERKKVGFARPTLIIPPPELGDVNFAPYSARTIGTIGTPGSMTGPTPGMYGRKASAFVFNQFNGIKSFTVNTAKSGLGIGEKCSYWIYNKFRSWSKKWFTHFFLSFVLILYTLGGAGLYTYIEGKHEKDVLKYHLREERYELVKSIREVPTKNSTEEWIGDVADKIRLYEQKVIEDYQINQRVIDSPNMWTMWNSLVFCATIYTTIGYGHICPQTITGKALTIVYSIIGIPLFLIALTDFGKLFTRGIKFLWSFVRRLYYTGSCRKVRKTAHVQEIFKGAQMMYEIATFRRPSAMVNDEENPEGAVTEGAETAPSQTALSGDDTPTTPNMSVFEIDDEFNLPISVALFILISYIFIGAVIYSVWEEWKFFDSFYFVFISMSTIGFGDYVPKDPICMLVSIVYLVFGLALMSMCINVVQEKLTDTFKQASAKISSSMGLEMSDSGSLATVQAVEMAAVHELGPIQSPKSLTGQSSAAVIDLLAPRDEPDWWKDKQPREKEKDKANDMVKDKEKDKDKEKGKDKEKNKDKDKEKDKEKKKDKDKEKDKKKEQDKEKDKRGSSKEKDDKK